MDGTNMQWATEKPTQEGWYWILYDYISEETGKASTAGIVQVKWRTDDFRSIFGKPETEKTLCFQTIDDGWWDVEIGDFWIGPLPLPELPK